MIHCDQALELISASLDEALTPAEQQALDSHLADCPACRALLADFQKMQGAFAALTVSPPDRLCPDVMARIAAQKAEAAPNVTPFPLKKAQRRPWVRWAAAAAVFAVVLLGAGRAGMLDVLLSRNAGAAPPAVSDAAEADNSGSQAVGRSSGGGAETAEAAQAPALPQDQAAAGDGAAEAAEVPETAVSSSEDTPAPARSSGGAAEAGNGATDQPESDAVIQPAEADTPGTNALTAPAAPVNDAGGKSTASIMSASAAPLTQAEAEDALLDWLEAETARTDQLPTVISLGLSSDGTSWLFACKAEDGVVHYAVPRSGGPIEALYNMES